MAGKSKKPTSRQSLSSVSSGTQELAKAFRLLASRLESAKQSIRTAPLGQYEECTIYRVRSTTVRSYKRRSYIAVRLR